MLITFGTFFYKIFRASSIAELDTPRMVDYINKSKPGRYNMRTLKIFGLILVAITISLGYSFRLPVVFWDDPATSASCTLGVEPGATDDYDLTYDLPAIPFTMVFDAQSVLESGFTNLRNDIRSDTDSMHIWTIEFLNFTAPNIIAKWNPGMVPSDSIRQMSISYGTVIDTSLIWADMAEVDSLVIPVGYHCYIRLEQAVEPEDPDTIPPTISDWVPEDGDTMVSPTTTISFMAYDSGGIDTTIFNTKLWLDTMDVSWFCTRTTFPGGMQVTYSPFTPLTEGHTYTAIAQVQDLASPPNIASDTITFTVSSSPPESIFTVTVWATLTGFPPPPTQSGTKITFVELGIWDTTEATGMVTFDSIPAGTYNVTATRDGYFTDGMLATIERDTMLIFALTEDTTGGGGGLAIDGTVELADASDFSGSIVTAYNTFDSTSSADTTDALGYYNISGLTPGLFKVRATHDGYAPDSAFAMMFFADTTIDFSLGGGAVSAPELLVIDWDNGDTPIPGGYGAAERLYDKMSMFTDSIDITAQDPDITTLNLTNVNAVALVTGTRLGVNEILDNGSLEALRTFVEGGGNIYWEGPDAGTDYLSGSLEAQNFFYLYGCDIVDEGESAATGNIEHIQISTNFSAADTMPYHYRSEADHYIDVFTNVTSTTRGFGLEGDFAGAEYPRIVEYEDGGALRILSSIYSTAIDDEEQMESHIYSIVYDLLGWTDVPEKSLPREMELISVHPNPFNASCRIIAAGDVEIYTLDGRKVSSFRANNQNRLEVVWEARDLMGRELPSGVYLAVVRDLAGRIIGGRQISVVR